MSPLGSGTSVVLVEAAGTVLAALVVTAPFYTRTSGPEIEDHFHYVKDATSIPLIAYDIPVCVHSKLDRAMVVRMAREGVVVGLKDSSGDDGNFRYVLSDLKDRPDISLMTGSEIVVDSVLAMGAHGVVPGLGNVDPAGYVRLWDAAQRGDWAVPSGTRCWPVARTGAGGVRRRVHIWRENGADAKDARRVCAS